MTDGRTGRVCGAFTGYWIGTLLEKNPPLGAFVWTSRLKQYMLHHNRTTVPVVEVHVHIHSSELVAGVAPLCGRDSWACAWNWAASTRGAPCQVLRTAGDVEWHPRPSVCPGWALKSSIKGRVALPGNRGSCPPRLTWQNLGFQS